MPTGIYLRSGTDWHLDASGLHTFEAFVEDRGLAPSALDPIPIQVFLDYASWFQAQKHLAVDEVYVASIERHEGQLVATFDEGSAVPADQIVAAPGCRLFAPLPEWAADLPAGAGSHTSDLVRFDDFAGRRVLI